MHRHLPLFILSALLIPVLTVGCGRSFSDKSVDKDSLAACNLPDTLRVATLYSPTSFFIYRDEKMGYDYDMLYAIAKDHSKEIDLCVAPSLSQAIEWLDSGRIDLIAYEVPVTAEFKERVRSCGEPTVTRQVLVQPRNLLQPIRDVTDLAGHEIYVERGSKYHQRLENLNNEIGGGILIRTLDNDTIIAEDLIEMVAKGEIPLTIVDSDIARLNRTYFPSLDISMEVSMDQRSAWGVALDNRRLADSIDKWMAEATPRQMRSDLLRRFFELSKSEPSLYTLDFSKGRISEFDPLFREAAAQHNWDWRLLAAQAFVESRFDATQVSWAGARGIMQIMPGTARAYGVSSESLTDNKTSIDLSLKIIESLDRSLAAKVPDRAERQKFVLAAYNSGLAHILDAIALAKVTGHDPQKWDNNVESALLLKSNPEFYNNPVCHYGYFRGRQTTEYVRHVTEFYTKACRSIKS